MAARPRVVLSPEGTHQPLVAVGEDAGAAETTVAILVVVEDAAGEGLALDGERSSPLTGISRWRTLAVAPASRWVAVVTYLPTGGGWRWPRAGAEQRRARGAADESVVGGSRAG